MAAAQRPVTQEALTEPSGDRRRWKELPSWFPFGEEDRNIPAAVQHHMARRARAHRTIEIPGASHAIAVAHPDATARLVLHAAAGRLPGRFCLRERGGEPPASPFQRKEEAPILPGGMSPR